VRLRPVYIFAVIAVMIQGSPLRVCAMQKLALGTNCHDGEALGVTRVCGDHADCSDNVDCDSHACPDHHDGACICEVPKAPAKATAGCAPAPGHLMPLAQAAPSFMLPPLRPLDVELSLTAAPSLPPALVLPLLI
jgi:hypothetical protein